MNELEPYREAIEIDQDLEELGISNQEIVIGFHHPALRENSDYAIA
jgi:XisI protein